MPTYSLNNDEQKISVQKIITPGSYELILYATESAHYKESNRVKVNFTVRRGNSLGVVFDSQTFEVDGTEKKLEAKNVPAGYHVQYENNTATKQGKYNAVCKVYNEQNELKLTLNALLTMDNKANVEFDEYLKQFFVDYLTGDYLSMNIFLENPENFGFVRDLTDEAKWYTYEPIDANYKEEGYAEMNMYYDMLKEFKDADLSYQQQISYKALDEFFVSNIEYYAPESLYEPQANQVYIDQFGGYAADFATYIEAYQLRREQDIKDVISYIKSLPEAFASYVQYAKDRADAGYPLSDYTIDEMVSFLKDVIDDGEDYYLTSVIVNKINACEYLNETQKSEYVNTVKEAMKTEFLNAYSSLAEELPKLKGKCEKEGYLAAYGDVGKYMYTKELKDLLGMQNLDMEEYGAYLKERVEFYSAKVDGVVSKINRYTGSTYNRLMGFLQNGNSVVGITDPYEMIDYLKVFATTIVPTLENTPEIDVKYMDDASAEVSNAVAYYMKSPLDNTGKEYITLNKKQLGSNYNDTLSTMAHEGYPGHLYAYLYDKSLNLSSVATIMTSTAHGEGWATYVSLKLYQYMKKNNAYNSNLNDRNAVSTYCDYMYYNDLLAYLAYTYVDYGIHYLGWDAAQVSYVMNEYGFSVDINSATDLYRTLIEMPAGYAAYGYGMSFFVDLHDNAKELLGSYYNEVEFNSVILSHGWCSFDELVRITDEYIQETLHKCTLKEEVVEG